MDDRRMVNTDNKIINLSKENQNLWDANDRYLYHYYIENKLVEEVFTKYPNNKNLDEVLLKVSLINSFYSTNIEKHTSILSMAEHIVWLAENKRLQELIDNANQEAVNLVGDIPRKENEIRKDKNGNVDLNWHYLSFASKYCCNSNKNKDYYIYDSLVMREVYEFFQINHVQHGRRFTLKQLSDYGTYCEALSLYIEINNLRGTKREVDWYIWGKAKPRRRGDI